MPRRFIAVIFVLSVTTAPHIARAANAPGGSYRSTCTVVSFVGTVLIANCKSEDGSYRSTQIDVSYCAEEVFNRDGGLQCYAKPNHGTGYDRAIPHGSYINTCKDVTAFANSVQAVCKDRNGHYGRISRINMNNCAPNPGLDNDNGNLVCHR